jgi:hypothetical protein
MSIPVTDDWKAILSRLNSIVLNSKKWKEDLTTEALANVWCGSPQATEGEIFSAEQRLGVSLPPSYRSFLSISNGWRPFSHFVERLLPVQEIERFLVTAPEDLRLIQKYYKEDEVSDSEYLDYETPRHMVALRHRYYPESLVVGRAWDGGGGELVLLNPNITFPNGEWETILFADWIPGNWRYRSFREFVEESIETLERIEST